MFVTFSAEAVQIIKFGNEAVLIREIGPCATEPSRKVIPRGHS